MRVSSFVLRLGARFVFCIAGRAAFFLFRFAITPPRAPLAPPEETPEERECRGWRSRDRERGLGIAIRAAENRASRRRRCALRGRRLLARAWRLPASTPFRQKPRETARGARFLPNLRRRELCRRRE